MRNQAPFFSKLPGPAFWLGAALLAIGLPALARAQRPARTRANNKKLIQRAFASWASGHGNFFDLLAADVQWTITGSLPVSKTYPSKQQFIDETVTPLRGRLATPIVPTVRQLYADGDVVVALWDGSATTRDGQPYHNTYCWAMTLHNGRITRVVAFLDLAAYLAVLERVPAPN